MLKTTDLPISTLAYIGDSVYELAIRMAVLKNYQAKSGAIHREVIRLVNSTAQSEALFRIDSELTDFEKSIVKRASNHSVPNARNVNPTEYRRATGFEALIGYYYLDKNISRIYTLLSIAHPDLQFDVEIGVHFE